MLLLMVPAAADTPGRAYGTLTIGDHVVRLTHAYVQEPWLAPEPRNHAPYVAGKFMVTLTDRSLPKPLMRRFGALYPYYPDAENLLALTFLFDRASGQALNCSFFVVYSVSPHVRRSVGRHPGEPDCPLGTSRLITPVYALRDGVLTAAVRNIPPATMNLAGQPVGPGFVFNLAFTAPVEWAPRPLDALDDDESREQ